MVEVKEIKNNQDIVNLGIEISSLVENPKSFIPPTLEKCQNIIISYGIYEKDKLVASCSICKIAEKTWEKGMGSFMCHWAMVLPDCRGNGYHRILRKKTLEYISEKSQNVKIIATVFPENYPSINNLVSLGFTKEKDIIIENTYVRSIYKIEL